METGQNIIVAFEFGSSAICGIAGYKKPDGKFNILGLEIERDSESVQRGVIYNIDTTTTAIKNIVERLSAKLKTKITKAYVGLAGQSLHSVVNKVDRPLETKVKITEEVVDNLKDNNIDTIHAKYENSEVHYVVPQEYTIGPSQVGNPVGIQAERIKASYVNIIARKTLRENIEQCMSKAGLEIVEPILISPLALADSLLSDSDKRSGCALIDFGAGTTTVLVYTNNILRKLVVIPIGGNNITADIANCTITFPNEAEEIKRKHGIAYVEKKKEKPQAIEISNDRTIDENELQVIVGARQEEIIANAWHHIKEESDKLIAGIVITGGAAQIKAMNEAIRRFTNFDRLKPAKPLVTCVEVAQDITTPTDVNIDTLIALLLSGEKNCVSGDPIDIINPPEPPKEQPVPPKKEKKKKGGFWRRMKDIGERVVDFVDEEEE